MFPLYSLAYLVIGLVVTSLLGGLGLLQVSSWRFLTLAVFIYAAGIAIWVLARLFVDPFLDGTLARLSRTASECMQYGRYRRIEIPYLSATVACLLLGAVLLLRDPWVYLGGLLLVANFLFMIAQGRESRIPEPVLPEPLPPPEPVQPPDPTEVPEDVVEKRYTWGFQLDPIVGETVEVTATGLIWHEEIAEAQEKERKPRIEEYADYVLEGLNKSLASVASEIRSYASKRQFTQVMECALALSFAQGAIEYLSDEESAGLPEYPKYPVETLSDENGDCEDKAILAAAIMDFLGYHVALILVPQHMVLGVAFPGLDLPGYRVESARTGHSYYWCEATAEGCWIGERPQVDPPRVEMVLPIT